LVDNRFSSVTRYWKATSVTTSVPSWLVGSIAKGLWHIASPGRRDRRRH
jgi:hypothetical protein